MSWRLRTTILRPNAIRAALATPKRRLALHTGVALGFTRMDTLKGPER